MRAGTEVQLSGCLEPGRPRERERETSTREDWSCWRTAAPGLAWSGPDPETAGVFVLQPPGWAGSPPVCRAAGWAATSEVGGEEDRRECDGSVSGSRSPGEEFS